MADEMAGNELRDMLTAFEGRLNERFGEVIKRMDEGFTRVDQRFAGVDGRLDGIDQRLDGIDQRLDGMDQRFDGIDQRFDGIDERFDGIDERLDGLTSGQHSLEAAIVAMDVRLSRGIAGLDNSMRVQFEKSHADMKLGLEAVQILDERTGRRFDEARVLQHEQIELLKSAVQR
jgi:hypothetical protein